MAENSHKSREQAELAFSKIQTQSLARNRIVEEHHAVDKEREAKTARLRELRLEKEAQEQAGAAAKAKGK
jgi:hypothetical protein